jgi:hypothetical protein
MGFDIEKFYENLLNSTFGYSTLHEDPKYVYIVAGSTKYFVLRKECIGNSLLNFGSNTELFYIVDSYCRPTAIKRGCLVACPWQ